MFDVVVCKKGGVERGRDRKAAIRCRRRWSFGQNE